MEMVGEGCQYQLQQAEGIEEFKYAKGFLDGYLRTRQLLETLISLSETGDEEWVRQQVNSLAAGLPGLNLTGQPEQVNRARRNLVREGAVHPPASQQELEQVDSQVSRVMETYLTSQTSGGEKS